MYLARTKREILHELEFATQPLSKSQLADKMGVVYQTIQNHLPELIAHGYVRIADRQGNANYYELSDPKDKLAPVEWNGEHTTITKLSMDFVNGKRSAGNELSQLLMSVFAEMYKMSADSLDTNEPKPLTIERIKQQQSHVAKIFRIVKELEKTCRSLLDNGELWSPNGVVSELIIKDPDMSVQLARSIAEGINEKLGNKNNDQ